MSEFIYGKNPILETFRAGRRKIHKFYFSSDKADPGLQEALRFCQERQVPAQAISRSALEEKYPGALTQGWAAEVEAYPYVEELELLNSLKDRPFVTILALDQIQDPQNLGALLRTAEGAGVDGVLIPADRSSSVTPAVCKAAAGAEEYLQIARVTNFVRALEAFKKNAFWVVGTSAPDSPREKSESAPQNALTFDWPEKTVLVLGAEGAGMRRLTTGACDFLLHLPLAGRISSLNVSAAGAVCLFERIRNKRI